MIRDMNIPVRQVRQVRHGTTETQGDRRLATPGRLRLQAFQAKLSFPKIAAHLITQTRLMGLPYMSINWCGFGGQCKHIYGIHGVSG